MAQPQSTATQPAGWDAHVHVFDARAPIQAGHYQPAHQPLERIEAAAVALGVAHLVLVQPSVYGTDNQVLLQATHRMYWLRQPSGMPQIYSGSSDHNR